MYRTIHYLFNLMNSVYLKAIDYYGNKSRFYALYVVPDLWGGASLVREFGKIGQPGTLRLDWHQNRNDAKKEMNIIKRQQLSRGYQYMN